MEEKRTEYYDQLVDAALAERGRVVPPWPEIDDPADFDSTAVLFELDGFVIDLADVLRSARTQRMLPALAMRRLIGDLVLATTFADRWPDDPAEIERGVRERLATSVIEAAVAR